MEKKKENSYGIIPVFKSKGEYLFLVVRHKSSSKHWDFPKGHKVEGESDEMVAKRELFEETGIKNVKIVEGFSILNNYTYKFEDELREKSVKLFLGIVMDPKIEIQELEISDWKWLNFGEALDTLTYKNSQKILKEAIKFLK